MKTFLVSPQLGCLALAGFPVANQPAVAAACRNFATAIAEGRVASDEAKLAEQRAKDLSLEHDDPVEELFEDQLRCADLIVIPKTGRQDRLKENLGALDHPLSKAQLAELDRLFPPPKGPQTLEMI